MTWLVLLAVAAVLWLAFPPGTPADRLKLHWHEWFFLFFSSSFIGYCLETLFVWLGSGVLMSRSSLLYGPFSIVWGLGALLMTLVLVPLSRRGPLVLFLGGAVLGGGFEYLASLFLERVFHRLFWNYAHLPLNLDGRTNLLYAAFWGVAGMLWVYWLAPWLLRLIRGIPPAISRPVAAALAILLSIDISLSAAAFLRMEQREQGIPAGSQAELLLDQLYSTPFMRLRYQNMELPSAVLPPDESLF